MILGLVMTPGVNFWDFVSQKRGPDIRRVNPYDTPCAPGRTNPQFWTDIQERIYSKVYATHKNKYAKQFYIDI